MRRRRDGIVEIRRAARSRAGPRVAATRLSQAMLLVVGSALLFGLATAAGYAILAVAAVVALGMSWRRRPPRPVSLPAPAAVRNRRGTPIARGPLRLVSAADDAA